LRHAARQARYRARQIPGEKKVTHQTSPGPADCGIVPASPPSATLIPSGDEEDARHAKTDPRVALATLIRCARCGRRGRFVRHQTLAHVRPWSRR